MLSWLFTILNYTRICQYTVIELVRASKRKRVDQKIDVESRKSKFRKRVDQVRVVGVT